MTLEQDIAEPVAKKGDPDIHEDALALKAKVDFMLTGYETAVVESAIDGEPVDMDLFNSLRNEFAREIATWKNQGGAR